SAASEELWKWIDAHGRQFGIGRPYLDRDPPHVSPIDGKEYVAHRDRAKKRYADSRTKMRHQPSQRNDAVVIHATTTRFSRAGGNSQNQDQLAHADSLSQRPNATLVMT